VASSRADLRGEPADGGYATAAAAMTALALSVTASAVMGAALTDLRQAKTALDRTRAEAALDGAQLAAVAAVLDSGASTRLRWYVETNRGPVEILAEPEAPKLALSAAAGLPDTELLALVGPSGASVQPRLRALSLSGASASELAKISPMPTWRACAASLISPFGRAADLTLTKATAPAPGRFSWRAGEVWRLRALAADGWADDRIVRLTGDAERPAAIIERVLVRGVKGGEPCGIFIDDRT
jgi:hypothetical protein